VRSLQKLSRIYSIFLYKQTRPKHLINFIGEGFTRLDTLSHDCVYGVTAAGGGKAPIWSSDMDLTTTELIKLSGKTVQLKCPAVGHPKPTIRWLKNGRSFTNRPIGKVRYYVVLMILNFFSRSILATLSQVSPTSRLL